MNKLALLIFFALNLTFLIAGIPLTIEGTVINNSEYMLQAGDEGIKTTNNNLDREIITCNKFIWNGADMTSLTYGVFTGHIRNEIIEYNYLNEVPMGLIRKSAKRSSL